MTYSIGFRAPSYQELVTQFLVYLQDHTTIEGMYRDPDICLQFHPARISSAMVRQAGEVFDKIKWNLADIERFIGIYLTEPKSHVFFPAPRDPLTRKKFSYQVKKNGLQLHLKSRMLCRGRTIFFNGDGHTVSMAAFRSLEKLADCLVLPSAQDFGDEALTLCYQWYLYGYIEILGPPGSLQT